MCLVKLFRSNNLTGQSINTQYSDTIFNEL